MCRLDDAWLDRRTGDQRGFGVPETKQSKAKQTKEASPLVYMQVHARVHVPMLPMSHDAVDTHKTEGGPAGSLENRRALPIGA